MEVNGNLPKKLKHVCVSLMRFIKEKAHSSFKSERVYKVYIGVKSGRKTLKGRSTPEGGADVAATATAAYPPSVFPCL